VNGDLTPGWGRRFPALFAPTLVGYANVRAALRTAPVPPDLVARLHVVAVLQDGRVLVCRSQEGWRFLPGGTREPGETVHELAVRELEEEAGARLLGPAEIFAAHWVVSSAERPYRPHLPHPSAYWAYAAAAASLVGPPTCPDGGEWITDVLALPPLEAADYLRHGTDDDGGHADLVLLARAMGLIDRMRAMAPDE
jgi:8-oxo-dGTP diphosphatase